jgi:hypothetical protein
MDTDAKKHIASIAGELAELARRGDQEFLAYLLDLAVLEARSDGEQSISPSSPGGFADVSYLRTQASRCVRLARDCRHLPISHDLEAIGMEMMAKAAELEGFLANQKRAG